MSGSPDGRCGESRAQDGPGGVFALRAGRCASAGDHADLAFPVGGGAVVRVRPRVGAWSYPRRARC